MQIYNIKWLEGTLNHLSEESCPNAHIFLVASREMIYNACNCSVGFQRPLRQYRIGRKSSTR